MSYTGSSSFSGRERFLPPLWVLTLLGVMAAGYVGYRLKELLVLLVLGYSIAYVIEPLLKRMEAKGITRPVGVLLIVVGMGLALTLIVMTAVPTILEQYALFIDQLPELVDKGQARLGRLLTNWLPYLESFGFPEGFRPEEGNPLKALKGSNSPLVSLGGDIVHQALGAAGAALTQGYSVTLAIINLALLPFIVYYVAVDFPKIRPLFLSFFPLLQRGSVNSLLSEIDVYVAAFVRGQILVGAVMAVFYIIGLGIVGIDLWFLVGLIAGFGNLVPYLGTLVGIALGTLMALVTFGDFTHLIQTWVVFGIVQALEGTILTPKILGDSVGLSPLVVILAVVAGGTLFGLLGVFLAVPGAAIARVLFSSGHRWMLSRT